MNAFKTILAVALVACATATPCTDICDGSCDVAQQTITVVFPQVAAMVAPNIATCKKSCTAVCTCTDGCGAKCGPAYQSCLNSARSAYNPFGMVTCQIQFAMCSGPCNLQCSATIVSGVVQQLQGVLTTFVQGFSAVAGQLLGGRSAPAAAPAARSG